MYIYISVVHGGKACDWTSIVIAGLTDVERTVFIYLFFATVAVPNYGITVSLTGW